ncbi:DUF4489 domain-containing protein [Anaerosalibacter massiliensis]|uniref:DUF4489 domain-containing protein n=1 Tax=Anaerosalibacter massiliensis TaxID=1347392 RepID=A0A9X2MF45_9FIRM|nr:DUF4489 domain-containing protein [Anaerosalibacter massiliensis]MCR2042860.1 DUF4489 domain-containing protein [Anaerosalibacter massiliensis]
MTKVYYYNPNKCCHKHEHSHENHHKSSCHKPPKKDCEPKNLGLKCKEICGAVNIPFINLATTPPVQTTLGNVSVDLRCYDKPKLKIDFSAIANLNLTAATNFTLTFRVYRRCDNGPEVEIDTIVIPNTIPVTAAIVASSPVSFSICDEDFCPGECCTYRITVEGTSTAAITGSFNISKGVISTLVTEQC